MTISSGGRRFDAASADRPRRRPSSLKANEPTSAGRPRRSKGARRSENRSMTSKPTRRSPRYKEGARIPPTAYPSVLRRSTISDAALVLPECFGPTHRTISLADNLLAGLRSPSDRGRRRKPRPPRSPPTGQPSSVSPASAPDAPEVFWRTGRPGALRPR